MPKLTKLFIDNEAVPQQNVEQTIYRDDELIGFALRVTKRSKTFIIEKRVKGRNYRISIGKYGDLSVVDARNKARELLREMAIGNAPVAGGVKTLPSMVTLGEAYQKYLAVRPLARYTRAMYKYCMQTCLADWLDLPFMSITKDMVEERHRQLTYSPTRRGLTGQARANNTLSTLRAVLNFASERYSEGGEPLIKSNPVDRITLNKQWHRKVVKEGKISEDKLKDFYNVICVNKNKIIRDYFLFLLLTGTRKTEAACLKWTHIDFDRRVINVPKEITKTQRAHTIPLSDFVFELLETRRERDSAAEWVFRSQRHTGKRITNVDHVVAQVRAACDYNFCLHDLRRTFLTTGAKLHVPFHILKSLVNHTIEKEVTDRYIVTDISTMRNYTQKITDEFVLAMGADIEKLVFHRRVRQSKMEIGKQLQLDVHQELR